MKRRLFLFWFGLLVFLPIYAEKYEGFCTRIWHGNRFDQCQIYCTIDMEIGKLTLTYPEKKTLIVESFDSKNNGVANYTCKDNQGNKYKVHLSENPFEAGTMLINIDNAKTGKPLWSYVIVYK